MTTITHITREELDQLDDVTVNELFPDARPVRGSVRIPPERIDDLAPRLLPNRAAAVAVHATGLDDPDADAAAQRLVQLGYREVFEFAEPAYRDDWRVDVASDESFPASDPPGWIP